MKVLEKAGLVKGSKAGLWVNYAVDYGSSNPYAAEILGNLRHWLGNDPMLNRMVKKLPDVQRRTSCKRS